VKWTPDKRKGLLIGVGIALFVVLVDVGLVWRVVRGPINGFTFLCALGVLLSLPALGFVGYRMFNLACLRYALDRNRLVIETAAARHIVPMGRIEGIVDAHRADLKAYMRSINWPGCTFGYGEIAGVGPTLFYAADPVGALAIVVTHTISYAISPPDDREALRKVYDVNRSLGPSAVVEQVSIRSPWTRWAIWRDRVAQGILLGGTALCVSLFGMLCFRYPRLPNLLPMHYDVVGQVDRVAPREEAFVLPVIALIIWAVNSLLGAVAYRRQRLLSYLAWSGALVVQVFFMLALWNIVT